VALVATLTSACAANSLEDRARFTSDDAATIDRLLGLIEQRLDVAPEVARTKWNTKAPIDDPPREERVLDAAVEVAIAYGLDPHLAGAFFRGQIEANKAVQHALHAEWTAKRQPPFASVADLGAEVRPLLDRLTPALVRTLAEALPILQQRGGRGLLEAQTRLVLAKAPGTPGREAALRTAVAPLLTWSG
jgi:chorismate mutase